MSTCFTQTRTFDIIVFISSGFFAGFSLANIIYYNRIRTSSSTCTAVSKGEANVMLIINIILFILSILIFLWSIYMLIFSNEYKKVVTNTVTGFFTSPSGGFITPTAPTVVPTTITPTTTAVPPVPIA